MTIDRSRVVQILLVAAVVVGIVVDGFFAIVNFYPVAPHPSRGHTRYVVMQLDEVQAAWFQTNILDDFNTEANRDVQLIRVDEEEQLQSAATKAIADGKDVILVELPATQTSHAVDTKLVRPFEGAIPAATIARDLASLGDKVLAPGKRGGAQYFLPRMSVVDVLVYRVSKVRDAVLHWSVLRPQIDAVLKQVNGHGLPADYELNLSPEDWDAYDMFVMAYFWSHRRYSGEASRPRIAHRTGDQTDGQLDIVAALYGMGGTDATFAKPDSRAAIDYFQWEALYRAEGLYPESMYGASYDDDRVIHALESGELFLAPIDAMDAFTLHGGAHVGALAHVDDPADLEFTELPNGASLALDAKNHPQRAHPSFSFRQDWLWALPQAARSPQVAYDFVRFLWRPEIHARECEALGMLPMHPEVVSQRVSRFRLDWMTHLFESGLAQASHGEPIPPALVDQGLGSIYAQLWTKIMTGNIPPTPESGIVDVLRAPLTAKPLQIVAAAPEAAGSAAGSATDGSDATTPAATDEGVDQPEMEVEDWETDVVIEQRDAGVAAVGDGGAR